MWISLVDLKGNGNLINVLIKNINFYTAFIKLNVIVKLINVTNTLKICEFLG